jgi:hypothetical protein
VSAEQWGAFLAAHPTETLCAFLAVNVLGIMLLAAVTGRRKP